MTALAIQNVGTFMDLFLCTDTFKDFVLEEASLTTANTYTIDGRLVQEYYSHEEWEDPAFHPYDFAPWENLRPLCYSLIKGKRTPVRFQFVLQAKPDKAGELLQAGEDTADTLSQLQALILNIRYDGQKLTLVSGTSYQTFVMDHTIDKLWDAALRQFLTEHNIAFEEP